MKVPARGFTHGGKFHADDVFATALLRILRPDFRVQRGFEVPDDFDGIVYDIGGGMFDHHDADRPQRPNGVPYAAFGLLWKVFGPRLVGEHQARLLDENFVQPLDLNDNTGEDCLLADAIGGFNPLWDSKDDPDACFAKAVDFAQVILQNNIDAANAVNRADALVKRALEKMEDGVVVLPCYAPWKNALYRSDARFVVYPSQRGGWAAQCVNDRLTRRPKRPFPQGWAGQPPEELAKQERKLHGIIYNLPGSATVRLQKGSRLFAEVEVPITQFGTRVSLANQIPKSKDNTFSILFDTDTGALLGINPVATPMP